MKKLIYILKTLIVVISLFFLTGCPTISGWLAKDQVDPSKDPVNPTALSVPVSKVDDIVNRLSSNNKDIGVLGQNISTKAEKISIANQKLKEIGEIKLAADKLLFKNEENVKNTIELVGVKEQLIKASGEIEDLKKDLEKSKTELQNGMNKILLLAYGLCVLGVAAGIVLIFFEQRTNGIIALGSSVSIMGVIYFLQTYAWALGIAAGFFIVALLGVCGYRILKDQNIKTELVKSFETIKVASKYGSDEKLAVTNIQSDSTINEVTNIKKKLGV